METDIEKFRENWPWILVLTFVFCMLGWGVIDWAYSHRIATLEADMASAKTQIAVLEAALERAREGQSLNMEDDQVVRLIEEKARLEERLALLENTATAPAAATTVAPVPNKFAPLAAKLETIIGQAREESGLTPKGDLVAAYNEIIKEAKALLPEDPYISQLKPISSTVLTFETKKKVINSAELLLKHVSPASKVLHDLRDLPRPADPPNTETE